jgi:hypothetical protein
MRITLASGRAFNADDRKRHQASASSTSRSPRACSGESPLGHVLLRGRDADVRRGRRRDSYVRTNGPTRRPTGSTIRSAGLRPHGRSSRGLTAMPARRPSCARRGEWTRISCRFRDARDHRRAGASTRSALSPRWRRCSPLRAVAVRSQPLLNLAAVSQRTEGGIRMPWRTGRTSRRPGDARACGWSHRPRAGLACATARTDSSLFRRAAAGSPLAAWLLFTFVTARRAPPFFARRESIPIALRAEHRLG